MDDDEDEAEGGGEREEKHHCLLFAGDLPSIAGKITNWSFQANELEEARRRAARVASAREDGAWWWRVHCSCRTTPNT